MKIIDCEQGTSAWMAARAGRISGSCMDKIISPTGKASTQVDKYINQLAAELMTGQATEGFTSEAMQRGKDVEEEAADYYALIHEVEPQRIGYVHTDDGLMGCSPDRTVEGYGLLEIKVPLPATCVGYMTDGKLAQEYYPQVQCQLYVTERQWCDLLCYLPGARKQLQVRIMRDEPYIREMVILCIKAKAMLDSKLASLKAKGFIE